MASGPPADDHNEQMAEASRLRSAARRDIGPCPPIKNPRRRGRCRDSLRRFCETYNPAAFYYGWSADHLAVIARIEEALTRGALFAFAMPRGSGKTALCRMAALWAASYRHCRYPFLIGATDDKAREALLTLKTLIRYLPEYAADFPEISFPAQKLAGIAHRAAGQTSNGESTLIEWAADQVTFPTIDPPEKWPKAWPLREDGKVPTSGVIISASGLTGEGIRGSLKTLTTGEMVRPDLVLLDDPQTPESAKSRTQNEDRLSLITADVLGMAGPGQAIAGVMPCTVIRVGDMVDQVLDRKKHPLWRGERSGILTGLPKNMHLWEEYFEVYARCALLEPPNFTESNEHYRRNQVLLEEGTEASWTDRKEDWEVSAVQSAMHLYYSRGPAAWWAEYMNRPLPTEAEKAASVSLSPDLIADRTGATPRFVCPRETTRIAAMIDIHTAVHWYAVVAWDEGFGGRVIDYGGWPRQSRPYYTNENVKPSLRDAYPGLTEPQRVYAGLRDLTADILGRGYLRDGIGDTLHVERCLVDSGWLPDTVHQLVRESPFAAVLLPSKGHAAGSTGGRPIREWKVLPGQKAGRDWRISLPEKGRGRVALFDPDSWKSFVADRLTSAAGGRGVLTLHAAPAGQHRLIADHCSAEYATRENAKGRQFDQWRKRPGDPDNHLFDAVVGCAVAASIQGLQWTDDVRTPTASEAKPTGQPKERWSDIQARKLAAAGVR